MSGLQEISCGSHGRILIETRPMQAGGKPEKMGLIQGGLKTAFDEVFQSVYNVCQAFTKKLDDIEVTRPPKKCSIEFGIQISTSGKAFIVEATSQANFKVIFEWDLKE